MKKIYAEARSLAFKIFFLGGLILIIIGLAISCGICNHLFKYLFAKAPDLWETPSSEFAEGQWYTCDNNLLYDYYGSDDSGRYYVTSTNDGEYMGFYVYNNQTELADKISNDTFEYLDGNQSELSQEYLSGKGYLTEMDATQARYFKQYFEASGASADEYKLVLYNFRLENPWKLIVEDGGGNIFYLIICLLIVSLGIYALCHFIFGGYKKPFKKSIERYGIMEDALDRDMQHAVAISNSYVGDKHLLVYNPPTSIIIPYSALVWAYVQVTTTKHTTYGIPSGTSHSYALILWDRNRTKNQIGVKNEETGHKILDEMYRRAPYFFSGFTNELAEATDNGQFNKMIQAVDDRRNHVLSNEIPNFGEMTDNNSLFGESSIYNSTFDETGTNNSTFGEQNYFNGSDSQGF